MPRNSLSTLPKKRKDLVYVWPLCTRIIHWMIALSFTFSFFFAFHHEYFIFHIAFGYIFGMMLLFRFLWGFVGPDYGTFKEFILNVSELKFYFQEKISNRWRKIHPGHNAASSWFTLLVLFFGLVIVFSGLLLFGVQEGNGLFSFLNKDYFLYSASLMSVHYIFSFILLFFALVHILGVLVEQFYHRTNMIFAMLSGYKKSEGIDTFPLFRQHLLAYGSILLSVLIFYVVVYGNDSVLTRTVFMKFDYDKDSSPFATHCTKCHKNYPPFMLPKDSWAKLMDGLSNHFGEEILEHNISKEDQSSIKTYLMSHSAEYSTHKLAHKTLVSLQDMRPISATKSLYWRETHEHLIEVFKNPLVKDKSNCFACHHNFEYGLFDNTRIHLP